LASLVLRPLRKYPLRIKTSMPEPELTIPLQKRFRKFAAADPFGKFDDVIKMFSG
jgi:hypothetical protein